jgi:hypothetical protein
MRASVQRTRWTDLVAAMPPGALADSSPECLSKLFIVNGSAWRSVCAYRCRRTIAIAAIMPKGMRMKSAMRMPIARPLASGERPGGTATNRVSQSSSFIVSSELRVQYTDIVAVTDRIIRVVPTNGFWYRDEWAALYRRMPLFKAYRLVRQKTTKQALNTVEADRVKNRRGKILTDCSDSQIAEDLESVSTAQGCKAHARAPTSLRALLSF